jgi:hypothetical protein
LLYQSYTYTYFIVVLIDFGLFTVGWYNEKYRRNEGDLDDHIKRLYLQDVNMAHSKTPQITAAIRGQDMNLDGRMDRMVWGGKAKLNDDDGSNSNSKNNNNNGNNDDNDGELGGTLSANEMTTNATTNNNNNDNDADDDDDRTKRRRKRRKKRKRKVPKEASQVEEERKRKEEAERITSQQKKLVLQSSFAGIAVGAVAVAAVSVFLNGSGSGGRK